MNQLLLATLVTVSVLAVPACGPTSTRLTTESSEEIADAGGPTSRAEGIRVVVGPSHAAAALLDSLRAARRSIHMTMYILTSSDVIDALVAQSQAGRDVRVILNHSFPRRGQPNQRAYDRLTSGGVKVSWGSSAFRFTHAKYAIIDGTDVWVMTMNAMRRSMTFNREFLALDTYPAHAAEAETIFQADLTHKDAVTTGHLLVAPINAEERLLELIDSANNELLIAAPSLAELHIEEALIDALGRGVSVRLLIPSEAHAHRSLRAARNLKKQGADVALMESPRLHAKAIVADAVRAYVGSINFTKTSLHRNREIGVIVTERAEVERIYNVLNDDFDRALKL